MDDEVLRSSLVSLLKGGNAHMTLDEAVKDFPVSKMNEMFDNGSYTPWHLLEHIRIAQWDILDFMRNPKYKEIEWPNDYWPKSEERATKKDWDQTLDLFNKDSLELQKIVNDPKTKFEAKIPHGTGQTVLREILLVADHNAYHIGEFAIMRQVMQTWGKGHK